MRYNIMFAVLGLCFLAPAFAEQAPEPCATEEFRQFDFWLGDWDVFNAEGRKVGENRITLEQGKCVLHEHWTSARGGTGESFNMFDMRRGVWHQTWVAASGNLLLLEGGLEDGAMVLSGTQPSLDGTATISNRISWTLKDDGSVEQRWDQSLDGGDTWQTGFLGIYRRKADEEPPTAKQQP